MWKDYFMSGNIDNFTRCVKLLDSNIQQVAHEAICFLLKQQLVRSSALPEDIFQVIGLDT